MIKCTVKEVIAGYSALRRLNQQPLPEKAAWRMARLLNKMKVVVLDFEETQIKLFIDAGGVRDMEGIGFPALVRADLDSDAVWNRRISHRQDTIADLQEKLSSLKKEEVEIDYNPVPTSLFALPGKTPDDEARFSANDFADAAPFLAETETPTN